MFDFSMAVRLNCDIKKGVKYMRFMSNRCVIERIQSKHFMDIQGLYTNESVREYLGGIPQKTISKLPLEAC